MIETQQRLIQILILSDEYLPGGTRIHAKMLHELAVELKKYGHNIVVVTPGDEKQTKRLKVDILDEIEIWRFRSPPIRGVGLFQRGLTEILLSFRAWWSIRHKLNDQKFDLCVNYSPTIFFAGLAKLMSKKGACIYLILRDFFPQWMIDQGRIRANSPIGLFFRSVEKFNYSTSNFIALQSPKNKSLFHELNPFYSGITQILYNWTSLKKIKREKLNNTDYLPKRYKGKIIFLYGGNMGYAQDMPNLIRLVSNMTHCDNAHFLFIGEGDQKEIVKKAAAQLPNLTYHTSISQNEFEEILREVDIGLFSLSADHTAHNFPGKLLGYMVNGIPILGSINKGNDLKEIVDSYGAGKVFVNGKDIDLKEAAEFFINNPSSRLDMGQQGIKLSKDLFSVKIAADMILTSYMKWKKSQ